MPYRARCQLGRHPAPGVATRRRRGRRGRGVRLDRRHQFGVVREKRANSGRRRRVRHGLRYGACHKSHWHCMHRAVGPQRAHRNSRASSRRTPSPEDPERLMRHAERGMIDLPQRSAFTRQAATNARRAQVHKTVRDENASAQRRSVAAKGPKAGK